jgi:hypothetical protein
MRRIRTILSIAFDLPTQAFTAASVPTLAHLLFASDEPKSCSSKKGSVVTCLANDAPMWSSGLEIAESRAKEYC